MQPAATKPAPDIAAYLAAEEVSEVRHEYIAGDLYARTGASDRHGIIALNIATALRPRLRGGPCQLFVSDMKLRLQIAGQDIFYYPDLLLSCDPGDRESHFRSAPCLLVEVTSKSTARVDRQEKALAYQSIPSLKEYLVVSQTGREVSVHRRGGNGRFSLETIRDGGVELDCLGVGLALDLIYEDVEFPRTTER